MRLLLIGRGHIGTFLKTRLSIPDDLFWTSDMFDLTADKIKELEPDLLVVAAGKTDLKWCEENASDCLRANVEAPLTILRNLKKAKGEKARMIHLSSGCIWDGPYNTERWNRPFRPYDPPKPACLYGWSKAMCDAMLIQE